MGKSRGLKKMTNIPTQIHIHSEDEHSYIVQILESDEEIRKLNSRLISKEEYEGLDRCVGSIFEVLEPGEQVCLKEGIFYLDEDLDLTFRGSEGE